MKTKQLITSGTIWLVFLSATLFVACNKSVTHDLIISNVNIIDVKTGDVITNQSVAIDGDSISAIYEKGIHISDSTKVINGTGKYLIPGLWDMHTHYYYNQLYSGPLLIANGITGVREMWGDMFTIKLIRQKSKEGKIIAPDIYSSGELIDGKPPIWPGSIEVATAEEARNVVNEQIKEGVDFIKVYSRLSEECFMAIAEEANKNNIPFAGHVPIEVLIYQTIDAGMASSEHLYGILQACSPMWDSIMTLSPMKRREAYMETFSKEKLDSLCIVLANSDMWLCPTLTVIRKRGYLNDSSFTNDKRMEYLPENMMFSWNPKNNLRYANITDEQYEIRRKLYQFQLDLIGIMYDKGVKFLAGTDYPNPFCFPGFSLHDEMSLLVKGGMPELGALRAATINGALFMGKEEFGTVDVGKLASLVLLNKNPLLDIENTKSIESVFLRGEVFNREALDKMLEQAKFRAVNKPYSDWLRSKIPSDGLEQAMDSLDILLAADSTMDRIDEFDFNILGFEYMGWGDFKTAQRIFKKNIELFPDSWDNYDSYAEACLKDSDYEQSLDFYQKSLIINPDNNNAAIMIDSITLILENNQDAH